MDLLPIEALKLFPVVASRRYTCRTTFRFCNKVTAINCSYRQLNQWPLQFGHGYLHLELFLMVEPNNINLATALSTFFYTLLESPTRSAVDVAVISWPPVAIKSLYLSHWLLHFRNLCSATNNSILNFRIVLSFYQSNVTWCGWCRALSNSEYQLPEKNP